MISSIDLCYKHTIFGVISEGTPSFFNALKSLVNKVAINIIIEIGVSCILFYLHHNVFALGFVVGFIFDKQVRSLAEKVRIVYDAQKTTLEQFLFFGGGGILAILAMPTSIIASTLYYSSKWGAFLYQNSKNRYPLSFPSEDEFPSMIGIFDEDMDKKISIPNLLNLNR